MSTEFWVFLGTIFGGGGLKLLEWLLSKSDRDFDTELERRKEYRDEIKDLKEELLTRTAEIDSWRDKYYELRERIIVLESQNNDLLSKIEDLNESLERLKNSKTTAV